MSELEHACEIARHMSDLPLAKDDAIYWLVRLCREFGYSLDSRETATVLDAYNSKKEAAA